MDNKDLKTIKKLYGENFARLCRSSFSTILETPGLLPEILKQLFSPTHSIFDDLVEQNSIEEFVEYINTYYETRKKTISYYKTKPTETAKDLLSEAGYILFPECKTEEDIQKFRKFYEYDEELCTFWGNRLQTARVWFAVKKNVAEIKRENFTNPKREDEYGTSVISIQFTKGTFNNLSIKNRYNHTVANPDATFKNNLDNIIPGLMGAFIRDYQLNTVTSTSQAIGELYLRNYYTDSQGKKYRYNLDINNRKFCENNIIIDEIGQVAKFDGSMFMVIDNYVFDFMTPYIYDHFDEYNRDAFIRSLGVVTKMTIKKSENKDKKIIISTQKGKDIVLVIDKHNALIEYHNSNLKKVPDGFLKYNKSLKVIDLPNVEKIGDDFIKANLKIHSVNLPKVKIVGNNFLLRNDDVTCLELPKLVVAGEGFLSCNYNISKFSAPKLKIVGKNFLRFNHLLTELNLPKVKKLGEGSLSYNKLLKNVHLPRLKHIEGEVFTNLTSSTKVFVPKCKNIEKIAGNQCIER